MISLWWGLKDGPEEDSEHLRDELEEVSEKDEEPDISLSELMITSKHYTKLLSW